MVEVFLKAQSIFMPNFRYCSHLLFKTYCFLKPTTNIYLLKWDNLVIFKIIRKLPIGMKTKICVLYYVMCNFIVANETFYIYIHTYTHTMTLSCSLMNMAGG